MTRGTETGDQARRLHEVVPSWPTEPLAITLDLGTERCNWNRAAWHHVALPAPIDLTVYAGLALTLRTDALRKDARVALAFRMAGGAWYYIRDAYTLAAPEQRETAHFADLALAEFVFGAEGNYDTRFHAVLDEVVEIALGVVNPMGIGTVSFVVLDATLVARPPAPRAPVPVTVEGAALRVNQQTEIPHGVFGVHGASNYDLAAVADLRLGSVRPIHKTTVGPEAARLSPAAPAHGVPMVVECIFDRTDNLPQFDDPDWEAKARAFGTRLGELAAAADHDLVVEVWNEAYLHLGKELEDPKWFQPGAEGEPCVLAYGRPLESMRWRNGTPVDPTRFTYWAGRQIQTLYTEFFQAVAEAAHAVCPSLALIGGWGLRFNEDRWACWETLNRPLIDACAPHLHGVGEHHYQGDVLGMPATYEVAMAYGMTRHGRPILSYNTETNNLWDAPARGHAAAAVSEETDAYVSRRRMVYNLKDILYSLRETPDKLRARAVHALWGKNWYERKGLDWSTCHDGFSTKGEYDAYYLLRNLRGRMLAVDCGHPELYAVGALESNRLNLVAFNDTERELDLDLRLAPPAGALIQEVTLERSAWLPERRETAILSATVDRGDGSGGCFARTLTLAANEALSILLTLDRAPDASALPTVTRHQLHADAILAWVEPGRPVATAIRIPEATAAEARRGWLRLVLEEVGEGMGVVEVAGARLTLPRTLPPDNSSRIREIPLAITQWPGTLPITFQATRGRYRLGMVSLVLETTT